MRNATRNTIILIVLYFVLFAGFWAVSRNLKKKVKELHSKNTKIAAAIATLDVQIEKRDSLMMAYELQLMMQSQQSKILAGTDSSNLTYQYLLKTLRWMGHFIPFNFAISGETKTQTSYNEYVISGRTQYNNLLKLTKQLEYQRAVITIEDYTIGMDATAASDTVNFSMVLRTHFQDGGPSLDTITKKDFPEPYQRYNLFKSRIYDSSLAPEADPSLPDIKQSKLIGLSDGKAFLRDSRGLIHILSPGSRVAHGFLSEIDLEHGMAAFKLVLSGLQETHYLKANDQK